MTKRWFFWMDERLLVAQLQDRKTVEMAFKTLVKQYKEPLYWLIRKLVLDHHDADDVLQETFVKVYKNIDAFKGESKLYTWLYKIATNESITFLQKKARSLKITEEALQMQLVQNLQSDVYFEGDQIQLKLQKAIAQLPPKQQTVFKMRYFEELKYEELAEILDTSVGALKANYHHAAQKIEEFLKEN